MRIRPGLEVADQVVTQKRAITMSFVVASVLTGTAIAQTPPNPSQQFGAAAPQGQTPIFRVTVVGHVTPAINYRPRKGDTDIDFKGTTTWLVTLTDGVYRFVCDPHATQMKGEFTVGSAQPPPPPQPPPVRCKVPKVIGKKLPVARRTIVRAHCRVGRIGKSRSRQARGRVVSQSPRPGVRRPRGTRVQLVVSRGRR